MVILDSVPDLEKRRLAALWALDILDTIEEEGFNDLVTEVSETCGTPISLISLVDADRQWFKARIGIEDQETPRDVAFCSHAIQTPSVFVVEDATQDPRFSDNPLVTGVTGIMAYAGAPLTTVDGLRIGTLCAIDTRPKAWTPRELRCLERLSRVAMALIEARAGAQIAAAQIQTLEDMRRSDQRYRTIIAAMREGVVLQDRASVIVEHNAHAARLLGMTEDQLTGRSSADPDWSLIDGDGKPLPVDQQPSMQCLSTGKPVLDFMLGVNLPHEERRWLNVNSLPLHDGDDLTQTLTTFVDITQLKLQEAALIEAVDTAERASAAKSTFLANVSHEIRTPLNGVIALAKALSRLEMPDRQREMVDIIVASGETLERILNDLLDIAKIEASRLELEIAPLDLKAEILTCTDLMRLRADSKGLAFDVQFSPEADGPFLGDALRLRQVVGNLTANAIKFTDSGKVTVRVEVSPASGDDCQLTITVDDTGVGLDEAVLPRLFERFVQGDDTITRRYGGTGLGLAICKNLVTLMGGEIDARALPGQGSSFTFSIPLKRASAPDTAAAPTLWSDVSTPKPGQSLRVLLAEDHPVNRRVVELLLEPLEVELVMAENGAEALERFGQSPFDLVLMDMQMPVLDGLSATADIRTWEAAQQRPPTPIIMMTANASPAHRDQAIAAGANGFITKPVTPDTLYAGIDAALAVKVAAA
ncbi:hybrid sensor histidine kinase/response regulator [Caulobacter henricii]|uniref:histidine kinase n=1 Tax=Caulobacter henricii TaxID=69395 RepID=A0A0P0NY09_9CAUL|nr:ATP-binding protein [Caulobacter henricii]ALL12548.1 histidine kinase [Caulobacter henricii]